MNVIIAFLNSMPGAVGQGLIWGIMAIGVYITFRILNISDLTVDGSLATGGAVCAVAISLGVNPWIAMGLAVLAGMLAGLVTGLLHTKLGIPGILAGILTQISLYSINLRIMGKANQSIGLGTQNLVASMRYITASNSIFFFLKLIVICIAIVLVIYWFFGTEIGSAIRATGNNEKMIRALGVDIKKTKMIGLMLANGLVGLSGALVCQNSKYGDINMGTGAIVIGLAAIVIGEVLMGKIVSFKAKLTSAVVGSVVYFMIRAIVLQLGMSANDMKLLSAVIVALALCVPVAMEKYRIKHSYNPEGGDE